MEYFDELYAIQMKWTEGDTEPLDGDEVDTLIEILKEQLNKINGNV